MKMKAINSIRGKDRNAFMLILIIVVLMVILTIVVKGGEVKIDLGLETRSSKRRNSFNLGDLIDELLSRLSASLYIICPLQNMNLSFPSEQIILLFLLVIVSVILLLLVIIAFRLLEQKTKQ